MDDRKGVDLSIFDIETQRQILAASKEGFLHSWERHWALDKKAQTFLTVLAIVATFLGICIKILNDSKPTQPHFLFIVIVTISLCIATIFCSLWFLVSALNPRKIMAYPSSEEIRNTYEPEHEIIMLASLSKQFSDIRGVNEQTCVDKARCIEIGSRLLMISFILVLIMFAEVVWVSLGNY